MEMNSIILRMRANELAEKLDKIAEPGIASSANKIAKGRT
jgi:hypothetical protein